MQLNLENMKAKTNYRIKLPNDSIIECPISYKLASNTISGTIFLETLFNSICQTLVSFWEWTSYVLVGLRLIVKTLRLFWGMKKERRMFLSANRGKTMSINFCYESKYAIVSTDVLGIGVMPLTRKRKKEKKKRRRNSCSLWI